MVFSKAKTKPVPLRVPRRDGGMEREGVSAAVVSEPGILKSLIRGDHFPGLTLLASLPAACPPYDET